jgi:hypothetical protein
VPEWTNGAVLKTVEGHALRGFESHPFRHFLELLLMKSKTKVKGDLILVVVLLLVGASVLLYNQVILPQRAPGTTVLIEIDGKVVSELALSKDTGPMRFDTEQGFNVVEIRGGQVRVADADCPDKICVNTGWRRHVGQVIVCMPHYFVVRIAGDAGGLDDLDGFTY